jgi:hypothetical protein
MRKIISLLALAGLFATPAMAKPFNADAARYMISNGQVLVHMDIERLTQSQTFKDLYGMVAGSPQAKTQIDQFKARFGIDPLVDVKGVTVGLNAPSKGAPPETSVYIAGSFKPEQIKAELKTSGADFDAVMVGKQELLVAKKDASSFAFVPGGMIAANSQKAPQGEVKGEAVLRSVLSGAGLQGDLKAASAGFGPNKDVWASFRPSAPMLADMTAQNPMMGSFSAWDLSIDFSTGLHLHVEGLGSVESAKAIADLANAQLAQAKGSPQAAMLGGLVNKAKIEAQGTKFIVDLPLSNQDVKQLQMMAMMLMMSMQQGHAAPKPQPQRAPFPQLQAPTAPAPAPAPAK